MEFLKIPGVPTGGFLVQEFQHPNGTQYWVRTSDDPASVFEQMAKQFKPALLKPLNPSEVRRLLAASLHYWPHAYALCVMACEQGDPVDAESYFAAFVSGTTDKPHPWAAARKQELTECLKLIASPEALRARLEGVRAQKLRALKLAS
jgi:hypothetical protein